MSGWLIGNHQDRRATVFARSNNAAASGLQNIVADEIALDQIFATPDFRGAILGSRHATASWWLNLDIGMMIFELGLRTVVPEIIMFGETVMDYQV